MKNMLSLHIVLTGARKIMEYYNEYNDNKLAMCPYDTNTSSYLNFWMCVAFHVNK